MKYILIVADGMSDYPVEELDGKTPLMLSQKPNIDKIALKGRCGLFKSIPNDLPAGSDIANLSILGYYPKKYYTGRGPLEAASIGISLGELDIAFRCNLITVESGKIKDYSAGHISNEESKELIDALNQKFSSEKIRFYPGVSYRNILILEDDADLKEIETTPPHDAVGKDIKDVLIRSKRGNKIFLTDILNDITLNSKNLLESHPVNLERVREGENPGNMIWLWGQGRSPKMIPFSEKYNLNGSIISAVDLIKGIGIFAKMCIIDVPGATGYYDTDYKSKAKYAVKALEDFDFVFLHVESPDEAGHAGDIEEKIKAIERIDKFIVGRLINLKTEDLSIGIMSDHHTPVTVKTHVKDPVPFAIYNPLKKGDDVKKFDEKSIRKGIFGLIEEEFMETFLQLKN